MCCQRSSRQCTHTQHEGEGEKQKVPELTTTEDVDEPSRDPSPITTTTACDPSHPTRMGCSAGNLACRPQSSSTGQEGQSLEACGAGGGAPKVPEVLSSLERLSQATGGMEKSWYRCIFPFGIISLVIGVAGTGVTYTYNDLPQTKVVSVILLVVGLVLVLAAAICWSVHKKRRRKKQEGGSFTSQQCPL